MNPEQLLGQLKASANARKAANLEIVNTVCREQFERGSKDFSHGLIGRLSKEKGGPATQSIRNKTGDDFKALISAWASHAGGAVKRQPKPNQDPWASIFEKIPDPAVRAVVGIILAEHKKLTGEVNLLKSKAAVVIDQRPVVPAPKVAREVIQILPSFDGFSAYEIGALKHAVSEKLLQDEGWKSDASGRIMNERGRVIFKIGFVSAIQKVLQTIE